ncbi:MAG: 4-alpha-glucanotransferase [Clostridia bacterium]|nr:4-alpha-glucanotransferase [Clostridia bacterium]
MERSCGVLMPIFSLPSKYGMGSFGRESYEFVDFLKASGQKIWQILPLVQTGYGNSPYSSVASESFNPYFISLDLLKEQGLLTATELKFALSNSETIDYGELYAVRYPLLRKAFSRFDKTDKAFLSFVRKKSALDYALFMAIKYASGQKDFYEWDEPFKTRDPKALKKFETDYKDEVLFWQFVQFEGGREWKALKKYANKNGIKIMGDMPLYVALDSVDVWCNPSLFKLDQDFMPTKVAGVPPDYFCEDGQLWGNPVYDYDEHVKDDFSWWTNRVKKALSVYDYVRIDHFRAIDRYYEIDRGMPDAKKGEWIDVPSKELIDRINQTVGENRIIAEDLGIIDDGVRELLKYAGYPGMKILSFAFNGEPENLYLPERIEENSVCYTGTHDNDTLKGLVCGASDWDKGNLYSGVANSLSLMGINKYPKTDLELIDAIIELGYACKANTFIIPMQDVLRLGTEYRVNQPATVREQNWAVRLKKEHFKKSVANRLNKLSKKYDR